MIPILADNFQEVRSQLRALMKDAPRVEQDRWQGIDVKGRSDATAYEVRSVEIEVPLKGIEDLDHWRKDIEPNLPWADDHFKERTGGEPLNPGAEWRNWPWGRSAARFRDPNELFNHTYMERLWPKHPRRTKGGFLPLHEGGRPRRYPGEDLQGMHGIGWSYGDLQDLVDLLAEEPSTRQAYIPLFFPEDTGFGDGGRKPCTLGYQFLVRSSELHVWYPLRSCDIAHHFCDDCYLAVRLLLWVLDRCREGRPERWGHVRPGSYTMHVTSMHVFENDRRNL